ncbi:hypothetical protein BH23ACT10_BH23ACT10_09660 [soil metagenome]
MPTAPDRAAAHGALGAVAVGDVLTEDDGRRLTAPVRDGATALMDTLRQLDSANVAVLDIGMRRPTLDDVFLTLTGRVADETPDDTEPTAPHRRSADRYIARTRGEPI